MPWVNQESPSTSLPAYLKGYEDMLLTPHMKDELRLEDVGAVGRTRPSGESVSVARLKHRVPKRASKLFEQAARLSASGDREQACSRLETAIRLDPMFAAAYTQLGIEYMHLGRLYDALQSLNRAAEIDPDSWDEHYALAILFYQAGDLVRAEESARRALALAHTNAAVHLVLGYILCFRNETKAEGIDYLRYAARSLPYAREVLRDMVSINSAPILERK
jgi:tetratricopeptide (TPR) repeat protein